MDKRHENNQQNLTKERYPHTTIQSNEWDSAESDTESLAQERAYQQQLRLNISNSRRREAVLLSKNNTHDKYEGSEDDEPDDDLQVIDSLEMSGSLHAKKNSFRSKSTYLDSQRMGKNTQSQVFSDEAYSHMRYDPNQRTISKGGGPSDESPLISVDDSFLVSKEKPHRERKEEYKLIANTSPPVMTPQDCQHDQPYLLHPQYGQTSAIATPPPQGNILQLRPSVEDHIPRGFPIANNTVSAELTKSQERIVLQMDKMMSPKDLSNKKTQSEDIVERNKITLGRNTWKYGSYAKTHALKMDMPQNATKGQQTLKETTSTEIQNEKCPQKTQQVKVTQMSNGKNIQRKEGLIPSRPQQPPVPRVKAKQGYRLSSPSTKAAAKTQRKPSTPSSSQPLPPAIHLNISLNTTSHLQPFQPQKGQESIINLVSLHGSPLTNSDVVIALSPRHQQAKRNKPSVIYQERVNTDLNHWNLQNIPGQWQRLSVLKEQLSYEEEEQEEGFTEVQTTQFVQHLSGTPTSTLSPSSSSYKVLPPIVRPNPETEPEVSPGPTQAAQRRVSDGYLMQMEKQKLLKTRPTYKAYSLKDYRQLETNVTLQGLGPDYTAIEKTKMRRQKQYSNVIRQQNKNTSRIPLLPAKDPEANDKKVTRLKALEYAKTIAKPLVPVQSKTKEKRPVNQTEGFSEHDPCVEGIDLSQLTTLELLRKRHEEEKQAVAQLRKIHAV